MSADIEVISKTVISDGKSELITGLLITGVETAILAKTPLIVAPTVSKPK
jgi:hypothetical protein